MSAATQEVETVERPTNASVGRRLGITHAHVSRLRYGQRTPGGDVMRAVRKATGWSIDSQSDAIENGNYAAEFRRVFGMTDDRETPE